MARISDIANAAAVSVTTVSRYLNGRPYVSTEVGERIAAAIAELGYHPNQNARTLRSGRTDRIAVIINRLSHPFYAALVEGISQEAHLAGVDMLIHQSGTDGWSLDRVVRQAREHVVDGLIVGTGRDEQLLASLVGELPLVSCDQALTVTGCPQVYIDHYASTMAGLDHLAGRGSSCILAISGSETDHVCSSDSHRQRAYREFSQGDDTPELIELAVRDAGIGDDSVLAGTRILDHITTKLPRVDAVFTGSDEIAAGLVTAARTAGIAVPERLRILGFDDQPIAHALGMSTVRQPVRQMGREAMSLLADQIAGATVEEHSRELEYELIHRKTT